MNTYNLTANMKLYICTCMQIYTCIYSRNNLYSHKHKVHGCCSLVRLAIGKTVKTSYFYTGNKVKTTYFQTIDTCGNPYIYISIKLYYREQFSERGGLISPGVDSGRCTTPLGGEIRDSQEPVCESLPVSGLGNILFLKQQ